MSKEHLSIKEIAILLYTLREWEDANLNITKSKICFDLFLFIAKNHFSNQSINSKTIHNSIKYSQRNIAYTVSKFKEMDLIYLQSNPIDNRIKNIFPTTKFCSLYESYADFINSHISNRLNLNYSQQTNNIYERS
jgi:DNA-binding MarR family transcriptional regulator